MAINGVRMELIERVMNGTASEAEKATLTPDELDALKNLGGKLDAPVDSFGDPNDRAFDKFANKEKDKPIFTPENIAKAGSALAGLVGAGLMVAGTGGLAGVVLVGIGLAGFLSSCQTGDEITNIEGEKFEVYNNVLVRLSMDQLIELEKKHHNELMGVLKDTLTQLKNIGKQVDGLSALHQELFGKLVDKLDVIIENQDKYGTEAQTLLNKISKQLTKMDEAQIKFYTAVLDKLDKIDDKAQQGVTNILEGNKISADILATLTEGFGKLDQMNEDEKAFFNAVLAEINKLNESGQLNTEKLLEAINKNTDVSEGTYDVAQKILAAIGGLNDKGDKALEILGNLSTGDTNVDMEDYKAFITATVQGIIDTYEGGNEKVLAELQAIKDKIPNGCKCDPAEILIKLEQIIEGLEQPDNGTHEGIVGDFGDLFG